MSETQTETRQPRRIIGYVDFMTAWEKSQTADEAAKHLGITKAAASNRASQLRKSGIPLKFMPKYDGRKRNLDDALKTLADLRNVSIDDIKSESLKLTQESTKPSA